MRLHRLWLPLVMTLLLMASSLAVSPGVSAISSTQSAQIQEGWYQLIRVIDGDTIQVRGLSLNIRLAGINAPEATTTVEPYGYEATATLKWLLSQSDYPGWIYLESASPYYDPGTNRYRAHVWFYSSRWKGWILTQGYLASVGLAEVDHGYYASDLYYDYLAQKEYSAQLGKCNIWGGRRC